jgi:hypothetical protein
MRTAWFVVVGLVAAVPPAAGAAEVDALLAPIKSVGKEGTGNPEARQAWRALIRLGPDALLPILTALDDADPTAANWLHAAVDALAERALQAKRPLPAAQLEAFVKDTRHVGTARRLAYEWLERVDPTTPARLLPGMLQDPSVELRRDAVALVLKEADELLKKNDKPAATAAYRKALSGARDQDQVELIAKQLKTLGVEVNLAAHFGFIQKWLLVGPFDNTDGAGFAKAFPPEEKVDLGATLPGKKGASLRWTEFTTADPAGWVDLNKALGKHMGATAYAFAAVISPREQPIQIRAGSNNAVKIFLNGKQLYFREEYHHGVRMDQHVGVGTLRAGRNEVLIKVCQNEQTDVWAQGWSFQSRLCDAVGGAVPLTLVAEKPTAPPGREKEKP